MTNNLEWSTGRVADLYRCRWQIEVFFKQIEQTLQLAYFLGHNANAVEWQLWIVPAVDGAFGLRAAALPGVAVKLGAQLLAFTEFAARRALAGKGLAGFAQPHGTARGDFRRMNPPRQTELPGFESHLMGQHA